LSASAVWWLLVGVRCRRLPPAAAIWPGGAVGLVLWIPSASGVARAGCARLLRLGVVVSLCSGGLFGRVLGGSRGGWWASVFGSAFPA